MNSIGNAYEAKTAFLPQLLMSAEAAKAAFEKIKQTLPKGDSSTGERIKIVMATVKGDIHDIGKNIVSTILCNYGYTIVDLGKDVTPERVLDAVIEENAQYVGLSALMTTTVPSMQATIELLRKSAPQVKIMVGGAVLTEDYARKIGADAYAKDAMEAVRVLKGWSKDKQ